VFVGDAVGSRVGELATYVGTSVGWAVGALVGEAVGAGVGLPGVYVGTAVGETVGFAEGALLGLGVGEASTAVSDNVAVRVAELDMVTILADLYTLVIVVLSGMPEPEMDVPVDRDETSLTVKLVFPLVTYAVSTMLVV